MKQTNSIVAKACAAAALTALLFSFTTPTVAKGYFQPDIVKIYFTRHAEKQTQLEVIENEPGKFMEICGEDKCAEELNAAGMLRAKLLADWFHRWGITDRLTHAFASHKLRTLQTIKMIAADAGLSGDEDKNPNDGVQEFPIYVDLESNELVYATELNPESTTESEAPTIDALLNLPAGSVALVAGHSGTLYDIMFGLGLKDACTKDTVDECNQKRYPIDGSVKVKNFGDIWKVVLVYGKAVFIYRKNLQPSYLWTQEFTR